MSPTKTSSSTARRREVRRTLPRHASSPFAWLRRVEVLRAIGLGALFAVLASLITLLAEPRPALRVGDPLDLAYVARTDFRLKDPVETAKAKEAARARVPRQYVANNDLLQVLREDLDALFRFAGEADYDAIDPAYREQVHLTPEGFAALRTYAQGSESGDGVATAWTGLVERLMGDVFERYVVLDSPEFTRLSELGVDKIHIVSPIALPGHEREMDKYRAAWVLNLAEVKAGAAAAGESAGKPSRFEENLRGGWVEPFPEPLRQTVATLVMQKIGETYRYSEEETHRRREAAFKAEPAIVPSYAAGDILAQSSDELNEREAALIAAEREAHEVARPWASKVASLVGLLGVMGMIGIGVWVYVFAYNARVVRNWLRGLALMGLMLLCQLMAVATLNLFPDYEYASGTFPTLLLAFVLAIAYDQRFALGIGAIHTALVTLSGGLPLEFALVLLTGLGVGISQLQAVRTRSKLVIAGLMTGAAMAGAVLIAGALLRPLDNPADWWVLGQDALWAIVSGVGVGMFVQGVLPGIERLFHVTTAMTLRELNDSNHPLLKRLGQDAPGTYQHSLRIADMAEAAAEAIGADPLLCRVGAMYHDIGKTNKPQYFVENQVPGHNRHSKLSPAMSLLIIVGHVKDGSEMAREYGLPTSIRHIIESHHGTTLVEYFYHAARKQKESEGKPGPGEFDFRYPGPKPQTKEAAILMLCDAVEAVARSLPEPTPVRLEQTVTAMANKRLMDNQFDECHLTLRELAQMEAAITKTLCAIYHARIKYPGDKKAQTPDKPLPAPNPTPADTPPLVGVDAAGPQRATA